MAPVRPANAQFIRVTIMSKSDFENRNKLSRRQALLLSAAGGMAPRCRAVRCVRQYQDRRAPGGRQLLHTACGGNQHAIRQGAGFLSDGVLTFKGIPYGQNTGGENRWLPANPPKPWDGEYPALIYGETVPAPARLHGN